MARKPGERDYRDLRLAGSKDERRAPGGNPRDWWNKEGSACAGIVKDTVSLLQKNQTPRLQQAVASMRLYGNLTPLSNGGATYTRQLSSQRTPRDRVTYSAAQSCVDTVVAKVGETKPRPFFLTSGGSYRQQRKAKKTNQFIEGTFYENKTYDLGLDSFRDGAVLGDGLVHVFGRGGRVRHERVLCTELWVDEVEGQYGNPINLHWFRTVDRDQLAEFFPEQRKVIIGASRAIDPGAGANNASDMVGVVESWHLGAMNEDGDLVGGKHAICLASPSSTSNEASAMLVEPEEWQHPWFPFARFRWAPKPYGYWSQGGVERIQGVQINLNEKLGLMQKSWRMMASFKLLLHNGSAVVKESFNNDIGAIITWSGTTPPQYITPQPFSEMLPMSVREDIERIYREFGVSEMSASSKKPAGLNSGKAIREAEDIESDRFKTIQRHNDNLYLEIAMMSVAIADEMSRQGKLRPVRVPSRRDFSSIDWKKDIGNVSADEFVLQCFPVSRLPRDPAGRLQTIQEYVQAGFMTARQGRRALDFPDIDAVESLANAQEDVICKTLDAIVDEGEYAPPEPTDDLSMCKEMALEYIQRYRLLDLEDEKLDYLRRYSAQVDELMGQAAAAVAPQMAAQGGPQAAPMAPPQSDLLPNAPKMAA